VPHTLFISDLHLSEDTPLIRKRFLEFLAGPCRDAEALYILGDLFETWVGDDDMTTPFNRKIVEALKALTASGTVLFLMHGNRDFLLGQDFAEACDATLLPDPTETMLYGVRTVLTHGDQLCTDDAEYQAYRKQVRSAAWQRQVLALPLETRYKMARDATAMSHKAKQTKTMEIMDVAPVAVMDLLRKYEYPRLIHGHTHRPARHVYRLDDHVCERWVLQDWNASRVGALRCDSEGCQFVPL
jgi:UDP-2,3-diacylglucosamine hydrolase